jgi:hypothetical protein
MHEAFGVALPVQPVERLDIKTPMLLHAALEFPLPMGRVSPGL